MSGPTDRPLTENQRRPLIDDEGRALLQRLLEHHAAPLFNHTCGARLSAEGLATVREFDEATAARPGASPVPPPWVEAYAADVQSRTPIYRRVGKLAPRFEDTPTVGRVELIEEPWSFVPDDHPLDDMVVYATSGTSDGREAQIASTPEAAASYAVMIRAAMATRGLKLRGGPGRTAVAQVCWQRRTFTYASISSFLGQGGILKLNLNPDDWRDPADISTYLDALDPEVVTGDPVAFDHLAELPSKIRPTALLSSAMTLTTGLASRLEKRFDCPVIDVYGMNEAGPIAAATADGTAYEFLQPGLHVEILDEQQGSLPLGERGELVLTGGFNPALPLLRYRSGDYGALEQRGDRIVLVDLEGRSPVPFVTADGRAVNTIDITGAFRAVTLARYQVHQRANTSLLVGLEPFEPADVPMIRTLLDGLFGALSVEFHSLRGEPEQLTYSTELGFP